MHPTPRPRGPCRRVSERPDATAIEEDLPRREAHHEAGAPMMRRRNVVIHGPHDRDGCRRGSRSGAPCPVGDDGRPDDEP